MTTTAPMPFPPDLPVTTVFGRSVVAEWTRLRTLRSTWWTLLAGASLMLFIGAAAGAGHDGGSAPIWIPVQFAIVPGQFAFLMIVLLAVTGEYATGAIRSTLQWVPQRPVLLAVRILLPVAFATASAVVISAATVLVSRMFVGSAAEAVPADIAASLGRIALVVAFGSSLTVGLGLLLRSTAGTLTAIFLLILALPIALGNTGVPALVTITDGLPGRAIVSMVVVDEVELTRRAIATVMIAWTTAAIAAGGWSLIRRDTT